jgi:hypothetical protein
MRWKAYMLAIQAKSGAVKLEVFGFLLPQKEKHKKARNSSGQFQIFNESLQEGHSKASICQNQINRSYSD